MAKMKQQRVKAAAEAKRHDAPSIDNRRARHEYHILESLEAGLVSPVPKSSRFASAA